MKKIMSYIYAVICAGTLIAVDRITKYLAYSRLASKGSVILIDKVLRLTYVENTGAAWGILSGKQYIFYILTTILVLALIIIYAATPSDKKYRFFKITLVVLFAGAIGNFIDRLLYGYVKDFIDFCLINFPVFNVADICITVSMILLILAVCFKYKDGDFDYLRHIFKRNKKQNEVKDNEE